MRKTHLLVLVVVAVAVVLAVGAISAYAINVGDTQAPVTTSDAAASYWNTASITATATDDEGVAYIYTKVDHHKARLTVTGTPAPKSAQAPVLAPLDLPLSAGKHTIKFWAQDINGNVEPQKVATFTFGIDTAKPVTTATGATDGAWYKTGVTVHLAAADGADESGVEELSYELDGAAPTVVAAASADVAVPAANGAHTIVYHATDVAGNAEAAKTLTVNVDVTRPVTSASAASVARGHKATLKYKVADAGAGKATVVIKIKKRSGKVVQTIKAGAVAANAKVSMKFTCKLAKGVYTYAVYATDMAGNTQAKAGSAKLTVK